jgi:DNA repair exonuclease SbcCD ATPase subunit
MKIIKIEWRNIFSYGNKIETLDFGNEGKLWQLSGRSGSGKSSLLNIPKLLLYGKTEGSDGKPVKIGNIANRINKNGWIRGEILKGTDLFVIERTFSPQSLTVYKNGENLDKAGLKDMQGIIDNEIMDNMPYHIFANVMMLSLNSFKSFISMSPNDKRQIIDKIFSLEIINKVYELVKKDMRELGNAINISNSQVYSLEQTIKTSNAELENLSNKNENDNKDQLEVLRNKMAKCKEIYDEQAAKYTEMYNKYIELTNSESQYLQIYRNQEHECNATREKIKLFNEDKCPTCGTPFNGEEFDDLRRTLQDKLDNQELALQTYLDSYNTVSNMKIEYANALNQLKINLDKIVAKQNEFIIESKSIENAASKTNEYASIQRIINETTISKVNLEKSIEDANKRMNYLEVLETMYSNDGIKQQMMQNYLPTLNEEIKNTLIALSFPYSLEFDNNFDPHLECLGEPIESQSLSTGEHKKVDLTVLCAILRMLKRKYPQINLVCLDETLSSLDYESSTDIITYLHEIASSMSLNIFIVSHTQLDENLFDVRIHIDKNSGFSDLTFV